MRALGAVGEIASDTSGSIVIVMEAKSALVHPTERGGVGHYRGAA